MKKEPSLVKLLSNAFDKIHILLSLVRAHVEKCGNNEAIKTLNEMEPIFLSLLHKLRKLMDIPYDWHEKKA